MDNLTHSLAGALLGQMGLKRLTGRATATLVIAANIPDIDAVASVFGTTSLAMRRGITHGPIALLLLPLMLTGLVLAWERWRPNKAGVPVRAGPLLLLAYIGTLSHPALDWLNSYGIRLLEPFSSRWYAGDTLFIIDVWVWTALIGAFVWSRRREKRGGDWQRPAWIGFTAICAYIFANGLISGRAEAHTEIALEQRGRQPELVVANPLPVTFWRRRMLWRDAQAHGTGDYGLLRGVRLVGRPEPNRLDHPALAAARNRPDVRAYLFWSRMPHVIISQSKQVVLVDQRFSGGVQRGQFAVPLGTDSARTIAAYDPVTVERRPGLQQETGR